MKQQKTNRYMLTARLTGLFILIATITYMVGDGLLSSILSAPDYLVQVQANNSQVLASVLIKYVTAAANVSIAIVLFPLLRKYSETVSIAYVVARIFDGLGITFAATGTLALLSLSQDVVQAGTQSAPYSLALGNLLIVGSDITFTVTMIALGVGSIPFCALLYRTALVPRPLAALGLVGYVAITVGMGLELSGMDLQMMHYIPGGLFEAILPLWLIVKGFNAPATTANARTEQELSLSQA